MQLKMKDRIRLEHKYSRLWRVYAVFEWKLKVERKPVRHDEVDHFTSYTKAILDAPT